MAAFLSLLVATATKEAANPDFFSINNQAAGVRPMTPPVGDFSPHSPTVVSPTTVPVANLPPRSMASFKNALLVVVMTQDNNLLQKLVYPVGIDAEKRDVFRDMVEQGQGRSVKEITEESATSLGTMGNLTATIEGHSYKPNLKHLGYLRVAFAPDQSRTVQRLSGMNFAYGMKDGAYYLVAAVRAK